MSDIMISEILHRSAEVKNKMISVCAGPAEQAAQMIATSMREGGKLMLCGNGGSAGDSQHLAAEFVFYCFCICCLVRVPLSDL